MPTEPEYDFIQFPNRWFLRCKTCGAIVGDRAAHTAFHAALEEASDG